MKMATVPRMSNRMIMLSTWMTIALRRSLERCLSRRRKGITSLEWDILIHGQIIRLAQAGRI